MFGVTSFLCYDDAAVVSVVSGVSVVSVGAVSKATAGSVGVWWLISIVDGGVTRTVESAVVTEAAGAVGSVTAGGGKASP